MTFSSNFTAPTTLEELLSHRDEQFIHCAYQCVLGRAPDPEGLSYYLARVRSGISKIEILSQLRQSREGKAIPEKLVGLDRSIRINRYKKWPFIGLWLTKNSKEYQTQLQAINNQLYIMENVFTRQFNHLYNSFESLQHDIAVLSKHLYIDENAEKISQVHVAPVEDYQIVSQSDLFNSEYYLKTYPDVASAGINPLDHYLSNGWLEGRNPSPEFDTKFYLATNRDVTNAGVNPLVHYVQFGAKEGRAPKAIHAIRDVGDLSFMFNNAPSNISLTTVKPIDIVIPIYNGYDYLDPLFHSILINSSMQYRLIAINDCSPDKRVDKFLKEFQLKNPTIEIILLNNEKNLGFVKSVNKAVELTNNHFVILNTDTEVPSRWLERLMYPIFEMDNIASTTPFTNAGTICSFPNYLEDNLIFEGVKVEELDHFFKYVNFEKTYIEIPTGVGFCMGVNKQVVDNIGMFDEIFGKGYGEENDWCQRAIIAGYKNLHVTNLFVYHKHGGSFASDTKKKLIESNSKIINARYPFYEKQVQSIISENKLYSLRGIIKLKALCVSKTSHLVFDHSMGGGANYYSEEKISGYLSSNGIVCLVKFDFNDTKHYLIEFKHDKESVLFKTDNISDLYSFISEFQFKNIFINSIVSFPEIGRHINEIVLIKGRSDKYTKLIVPIHDFFSVCPNYTLINETGTYCGVPIDLKKCSKCLKKNEGEFKKFELTNDIQVWRKDMNALLSAANEIICFSNSSKDIFLKAYPLHKKNVLVLPHDISGRHPRIYMPRKIKKGLRIGVLGGINEAKGANVIRQLADHIDKHRIEAKVILIGEISISIASSSFEKTGRYNKKNLEQIVLEKEIDIFLIPSVWPETYSFTTDEIMQMGYPLVVFNYGAPAERVSNYELGQVVEINQLYDTLFKTL
jgi:GT2 family glycosyltransferase